jgi:hypothetical protein
VALASILLGSFGAIRRAMTRFLVRLFGTWLAIAASAHPAVASPPLTRACQAPPLPAPTGNVVTVATEPALRAAVASIASNGTIVIQPGTYNLASGGGTLYFNRAVSNVTIRGATNRCDDVVLTGAGMTTQGNTPFGIWVGGPTGILIANLTIRDIFYHPIMLDPNAGGTHSPRIYNVRLADAGEQFIKVSQPGSGPPVPGSGVANGIVEYSVIEYSTTKDPNGPGGPGYTNGVDILAGSNWIVRNNLFRNIRAADGWGLAGPSVLAWKGTIGTIVEGNLFINCQYGIALGLDGAFHGDHAGGIVRNNFFHRTSAQSGDAGIVVNNSANTKVLHNTILLSGTYPNAIEYRFPATTGFVAQNNLSDAAVRPRDGASGTTTGNVTDAVPGWFVNAESADLHLNETARSAIDRATPSADAVADYDGEPRPAGAAPDVGADERSGAAPSAPTNLRIVNRPSGTHFAGMGC